MHLNPTIVLCITCINAILTDFLPIDLNEWTRLLRRAFYLITIWRGGATLETLEVLNEEMEGRESESRKEIQLKNSRPYRTRFVTKFSKIPLSTWVDLKKYFFRDSTTLSPKLFFREINSLVTYFVKPLRSRNFTQKSLRENFCNFHTA